MRPVRLSVLRAAHVLALAMLAALPSLPHAQSAIIDTAAVRRFVTETMRADGVPGLAVAVVTRDGTAYAEGFGSTGRAGERITPDTPFILGSMSKSFTALAVMQLVETGQIDLDAPLRRYLPDFAMASPEAEQITVRQLLAHTSGIPTNAPRAEAEGRTLADHVSALRRAKLVRTPGSAHKYASPNYQVLGRIVEVASGESFGTYVLRHMFTPLGMRHSYADASSVGKDKLALGHQMMLGMAVPRQLPLEMDRLPTAALMSSANDLGRFMRAQLRGGELDAVRVASDSTVAAMHRPLVQADGFAYAMGWRVSKIGDETAVHHGGIVPNYRGKMVMLPERGLGVVVLTNASTVIGSPTSHRIADGIAMIISGQQLAPSSRISLRWVLIGVAFGMVLITVLQLRGVVRALRAPRSVAAAVKEIGFAAALVFGLPAILGFGWEELLRQAPDMTVWVIVAATLGVVTGVLRIRNPIELHARL